MKMLAITLTLALSVIGYAYANEKWEISRAAKLHTSKFRRDVSYWISHKFAEAINPRGSSFFLWKVMSYQETGIENLGLGQARSVPVLAYHGLPNEGIGQIPNDVFIDQLKILKENGWNTVSLEEFKSFIKEGRDLPERSFLITFDDGRKDTFYPADPVLRDLGFEAVIFIITKRSLAEGPKDSSYYLSTYELQQMEKTGRWEVESHGRDSHDWYYIDETGTLGHYFSDKFWLEEESRTETDEEHRDRVIYDLSSSKRELESTLDKTVTAFAYPFGDFGQESVNYPQSASIVTQETAKIYDLSFYQARKGVTETFNYPEGQSLIKRIEPAADWSGSHLLAVLESGMAKDLPYGATTFGPEWIATWGEVGKGENLRLGAGAETTGSAVALNGSYLWRDYRFTVETSWAEGSNIVLVARQDESGDYFGCNFGPDQVAVKSSIGRISRNLVKAGYSPGPFPRKLSLGIEVVDDDVICLVNGEKIVEGIGVNYSNPQGGIGLEIWDEQQGKASADFDEISVASL